MFTRLQYVLYYSYSGIEGDILICCIYFKKSAFTAHFLNVILATNAVCRYLYRNIKNKKIKILMLTLFLNLI